MKKLLLLTLISLLLPMVAEAYDAKIEGIYYNFSGNEAEVTYKDEFKKTYSGTIVIPESIIYKGKTYTVTSIGRKAFYNCSGLTSVSIPNSVKKIDNNAFSGCSNLTSIIIPYSVTSIGHWAFERCSRLTAVTIPNSVVSIGNRAFAYCSALKSVRILGNITNLGSEIFLDCNNLNEKSYISSKAKSDVNRFGNSFNTTPARNDLGSLAVLGNDKTEGNNPKQTISHAPVTTTPAPTSMTQATPRSIVSSTTPTAPISDVDQNLPLTNTKQERTFAMIIANEHYEMTEPVEYALNDGKIFADYCEKTLGLPKQNIRYYEDATFGKMYAAIRDIKQIAEAFKGDIQLIVYYAGHGIPNEQSKEAYLLPVDADGRETTICYPLSKLYQELSSLKLKNVTVFLDACFSGSQRGEGMLASARGVAIKPKASAPQGSMVVFSAATDDETAYPYKEKGHGLFTYFLLKKLRDTKGDCTLGELSEYVQTNVRQQSVVFNRKSQTPTVVPSQTLTNSWQTLKLK